jgi:hypothetical protein
MGSFVMIAAYLREIFGNVPHGIRYGEQYDINLRPSLVAPRAVDAEGVIQEGWASSIILEGIMYRKNGNDITPANAKFSEETEDKFMTATCVGITNSNFIVLARNFYHHQRPSGEVFMKADDVHLRFRTDNCIEQISYPEWNSEMAEMPKPTLVHWTNYFRSVPTGYFFLKTGGIVHSIRLYRGEHKELLHYLAGLTLDSNRFDLLTPEDRLRVMGTLGG